MKIHLAVPILVFATLTYAGRDGKLLPVFQVVRFPNDPCYVTGGTKNGTCYTAEECSNKGGTNSGSCAEGFGVCCTFTIGCGGSSSENNTYFDSATTPATGACRAKICPQSSSICQIRLDFNSFVITGPSTLTTTEFLVMAGHHQAMGPTPGGYASQCLTDTFGVTNQHTMPVICGTNSAYHAYFEASESCHSLDFVLGSTAVGTTLATRSWSIKVTHLDCSDPNLPPAGCVQYHYGAVSGAVHSFNWAGSGQLADQRQTICVRREYGYCRICWYNGATDFSIGGSTTNQADTAISNCCTYGANGMTNIGYDCLLLPGASYLSSGAYVKDGKGEIHCGQGKGIGAAAATAVTYCSKELPFRVTFISDNIEDKDNPLAAVPAQTGFKIYYTMSSC